MQKGGGGINADVSEEEKALMNTQIKKERILGLIFTFFTYASSSNLYFHLHSYTKLKISP